MRIPRKLANQLQNHLQVILSLIELGKLEQAKKQIGELSMFVSSHLETKAEERAREEREEHS